MYVRRGKARLHCRSGLAGAITILMPVALAAAGCSVGSTATRVTPAAKASQISPHSPLTGPPADPFSGTPADHWGSGTAGIVLPAARSIGGYPAAKVEFAYATTRDLLTAAYLDQSTVLGGRPTAFADLLIRQERTWFLSGLGKTGVDKQGRQRGTRELVMSFAPGGTQLIGDSIKVHGTMHAKTATDNGEKVLDVDVDFIFAYSVQPPRQPTEWMRVVAQASWTVMFGNWQGAATAFEPWVQFGGFSVAGAKCGTTDGFVHPDYQVGAGTGTEPAPTGRPVDPYSVGGTSAAPGCKTSTGT